MVNAASETFKSLDSRLDQVKPDSLRALLIMGLIAAIILAGLLFCSAWGLKGVLFVRRWRVAVLTGLQIMFALICFLMLLVPTVILHLLSTVVDQLPSFIRPEAGGVFDDCLGACCCASVMLCVTLVISTFPWIPGSNYFSLVD